MFASCRLWPKINLSHEDFCALSVPGYFGGRADIKKKLRYDSLCKLFLKAFQVVGIFCILTHFIPLSSVTSSDNKNFSVTWKINV